MATNSFRVKSGSINLKPLASAPASPEAGDLYVDSSGSLQRFANGAFTEAGSGLNEQAVKNYYKTWANAQVPPGTLGTIAPTGTIVAGVFYADVTSGAAALVTSTDATLRGTTNYLSVLSGADATGARFFQLPAFVLDGSDLGKVVNVSLDVAGSTTFSDWDVVAVRYNSAGVHQEIIALAGTVASAGSTPVSAGIPTGIAQVNSFFISSSVATDMYALRFRRLAGAVAIRVDSLFAGPSIVRVGAAVTDWQSYTPTGPYSTNSTYTGRWRRVGDSIDLLIDVAFAGATNVAQAIFTYGSLFSGLGLTVDLTKFPNITDASNSVGQWTILDTGSQIFNGGISTDGTTGVVLYTAVGGAVSATGPVALNTGDNMSLRVTLPIANWSSNVTIADRAVEEYASNSSTSVVTESTLFTYGSAGSSLPSGAAAGSFTKRVRFPQPVQSTDTVEIEIQKGSGPWLKIAQSGYVNGLTSLVYQNNIPAGIGISVASTGVSTDVDIAFGRYAYANGATYGAVGLDWSDSNYSTYKWRVRKVSGGAQVGYPISGKNIIPEEVIQPLTVNSTIFFGVGVRFITSGTTYNLQTITAADDGKRIFVKNIQGGSVVVAPLNGLIDGAANITLNAYEAINAIAYNSNWFII